MEFSTAEIIGPIAEFRLTALLAIGVTISLLKQIPEQTVSGQRTRRHPRAHEPGHGLTHQS